MATVVGVGSFISLKQGRKMASRPQFVQNLSKDAVPGRTYRLFFNKVYAVVQDENGNPTDEKEENFMMSYVVGRDLNFEIYNKISFMTYRRDWYEMQDINSFKDLTGTDSYARIMRAAFEAQCEKEKADAEKEAKELAKENNGKIDERALYRKLDNIDMKYHGRPAEDGVQAIYATLKPAIGSLRGMLITECLRVPMKTDTNTPDWSGASYHYKRCSKEFIDKLLDIMDNPAYNRPDCPYVEVAFKYGAEGQKTSEAGRASTFTPISYELSLEKLFPKEWEEIGKAKVEAIAGGDTNADTAAEAVMKDAGFNNIRITPQELASTTKKWAASNLSVFTKLDMEAKETTRAAKDLISCGILDALSDIKAKVEKLAEESGESNSGEGEDNLNTEATKSEQQAEESTEVSKETAEDDAERAQKVNAAMTALSEAGAIDARSASQYLDIPEDTEEDGLGDIL